MDKKIMIERPMGASEAFDEIVMNIPKVMAFGGERLCDAYDMAIESMEKQVPAKPVKGYDCPRCGAGLHTQRLSDGYCSYLVDPNFCSVCGQAIDWGKE